MIVVLLFYYDSENKKWRNQQMTAFLLCQTKWKPKWTNYDNLLLWQKVQVLDRMRKQVFRVHPVIFAKLWYFITIMLHATIVSLMRSFNLLNKFEYCRNPPVHLVTFPYFPGWLSGSVSGYPNFCDESKSGSFSQDLPGMLWKVEKTQKPVFSCGRKLIWKKLFGCDVIFKYTYFIHSVLLLYCQI